MTSPFKVCIKCECGEHDGFVSGQVRKQACLEKQKWYHARSHCRSVSYLFYEDESDDRRTNNKQSTFTFRVWGMLSSKLSVVAMQVFRPKKPAPQPPPVISLIENLTKLWQTSCFFFFDRSCRSPSESHKQTTRGQIGMTVPLKCPVPSQFDPNLWHF